jgi:hypothetical protein
MLALLLIACDPPGAEFRPVPSDVPAIIDIGELPVVTREELDAAGHPSEVDGVYFGRLGAPEQEGTFGGATLQFRGTGGEVCVVVDPEAVFWNLSVDADGEGARRYQYMDRFEDDGDIDLSVGLTAYYTGSPGVEMGDFNAVYNDPGGIEHTLAFNECVQVGYGGTLDVHSGRATVEFCTIDTDQRAGIPYTVVLDTFALPHDDSILSYGVMVVEGSCDSLGPTECTLTDEITYAEPDGATPKGKEWFPELEAALCQGINKTNDFCEEGFTTYEDSPPCEEP